jgi:hypothetical protein
VIDGKVQNTNSVEQNKEDSVFEASGNWICLKKLWEVEFTISLHSIDKFLMIQVKDS